MMAVQLDEQTLTAPVAAITQGAILLLVNLVVGGVHASMPLPPGIKVGVAVLYSLSLACLIVVLEHRSDGGEEAIIATRLQVPYIAKLVEDLHDKLEKDDGDSDGDDD